MKVILQQDIKGKGKRGQMIEVSDGYARNYMLPRKLAVEATADNVNTMRMTDKAQQEKRQRFIQNPPKLYKNRTQGPSGGALPDDSPRQKSESIARPDVPGADAEAQINPRPGSDREKNAVAQQGMPGAQGPQEAVD